MKIGSISENLNIEKRISITPEIAKKYHSLGLEVILSKNYGNHLGINDKDFADMGVNIVDDDNQIINNSDLIR